MNWIDDNIQTTLGILGDLSLVVRDERSRRRLRLRDVEKETGISFSWLGSIEREEAQPSKETIEILLQWVLQSRRLPGAELEARAR